MSGFATLGDFAARALDVSERWRVESAAEGIGIDLTLDPARASGGERRRAALAGLVASDASLLLLDEPTNHLDIRAILWLENWLDETRAAFVLISHDRAFLSRLTRGTLWLDRGVVRRQESGFAEFEAWRDKVWEEEDLARHKLDRKIKAEARWAVEGISARRKRNMGRVRALGELRAARASETRRQGTAAMEFAEAPRSGKRVIEARGISKSLGGRVLFSQSRPQDSAWRPGSLRWSERGGQDDPAEDAHRRGRSRRGRGEARHQSRTRGVRPVPRRPRPRCDALGCADRRPRDAGVGPRRPGHGAGGAAPCRRLSQGFPLRRGAGPRACPLAFRRRAGPASSGEADGARGECPCS